MIKKINESIQAYHTRAEVSSSALKKIYKKSVWHWLNEPPMETKSLTIGTNVHDILQDNTYLERKFIAFNGDLRTKKGKEEKAAIEKEHPGKIIIKQEELEMYQQIERNFWDHKTAHRYMDGHIELSHITNIDGIGVRVRPDCISREGKWISDIKTCQDAERRAFKRDARKYGYPLQAVFYSEVCNVPVREFRFLAVETRPPYGVEVYVLDDDLIEEGGKALKEAWQFYKLYKEEGIITGLRGDRYNEKGEIYL